MTGKTQIETLTNTWYGFSVFSALYGLFMGGIGVFSLVGSLVGLGVSWLINFAIGRALLRRSSGTRLFLIVSTGLGTLFSVLGTFKAAQLFVHSWDLRVLVITGYAVACTWIYAKSCRTLLSRSVKAYVG
jgi:hypothetical protein